MIVIIILLVILVVYFITRSNTKEKDATNERQKAFEAKQREDEAVRLAEYQHRLTEEVKEKMSTMKEPNKPSRAQQGYKDGYVYIASNVGSFGEDVYKIGMSRRDDPIKRIHELSGASVPFPFDVNAMFHVSDASAVERALHLSVGEYRMNKVNSKKEFFNVPLDALKTQIHELGLPVDNFIDLTLSQEYLKSMKYKSFD